MASGAETKRSSLKPPPTYWQTVFKTMNEKILKAGSTLIVHSDRLFFLLSGKAKIGNKMLCQGDFLYFGSGNFISSATLHETTKEVDILETVSLFEIEMKIQRRQCNTSFWKSASNFKNENENDNNKT